MKSKTLLVIFGPTAIGKTRTAVSLARHFKTEVISADSRQFYKELAVGTAVPTVEEQKGITHHFLQHISINDLYSAGDFEQDALQTIETGFAKSEILILTGGSGLFIDAVLYGLDSFPEVDTSVREGLRKIYEENGLPHLQELLKKYDPVYYNEVDLQNPQRLLRALEVSMSSGRPFSSFRSHTPKERPFRIVKIGLEAPRDILYRRIDQRVDQMMTNGLLEEVKKVYPYRSHNALQTVGYKELFPYLEHQISLEEAIATIKRNTRRYAKRQLTWMRKQEGITWIPFDISETHLIEKVNSLLNLK